MENLIEQAFQQYGLLGLVVAFLVMGPGFTYIRTRNTCLEMETRAQELLNQYLKEETKRARVLEGKLQTTQVKLDAAREEMAQMKQEQAEMPALRQQVAELTQRISELEQLVESLSRENEQLRDASLQQRQDRS